ncbi:uncharacterized protein PHACADRAFT_190237 [Phanerochaete carnosa HHB-10118-sp]|uniref:ditrans,polycis-polyprenyl diphosphate synthase [(2E,6E)-farnesyldiphosphate specific] n=1 Tax=Phanerochaete carnosa (strain HHB-10118-sp) TaxID=650164 RepID=K5WPD6_PHACS|nr:uncharacterized protein PHACADRAFT_190237 [Phanerochaete carnosa HHB-10118-sp]EKM61099.1 hypothetical protein PHACADRAFT_190237 [Phanerochaete carnosa HHB-10118-sp]
MAWPASLVLFLFHAVYYVINIFSSLRVSLGRPPKPLEAKRKQLPTHLALLFATDRDGVMEKIEEQLLVNIQQAISWCRAVGIQRLTVYDRDGSLYGSSFELRTKLYKENTHDEVCEAEAEVQYPLTPPPSDSSASSSRSLSPEHSAQPKLHAITIVVTSETKSRTRNEKDGLRRRASGLKVSTKPPFTLHVLSRKSGKPAVAEVAASFASNDSEFMNKDSAVSVACLNSMLEGEHGFPPPDLMIVHQVTPHRYPKNILELHGFPPWQISLTEFYYSEYPSWWMCWKQSDSSTYVPLTKHELCRALDQYDAAEMRRGR